MGSLPDRTRDERGVSEIVGTVLLVGLVLLASAIVIVIAAGPIANANEQNTKQSAETLLQEVDSRLATLSTSADSPSVQLRLGDSLPRNLDTENFGYFNLTVNGDRTCSFQEDLHQIRYVGPQGEQIAYEAGGVFRGGRDSSVVVTSPDVNYRSGAIDVTLVNLTGNIDQSVNTALMNVSDSERRSRSVVDQVLQGDCLRPDNVQITVKSQYFHAWGSYFETEFDHPAVNVSLDPANKSVHMNLSQTALPRSVNDNLNSVINLSEDPRAPYMDRVEINNSHPDPPPTGDVEWDINVSKNAGNNYSVFVEPLTESGLDIGRIRNIDNATNVTRPPMDVILVLDESGSMDNSGGGVDDDETKAAKAQEAAIGFIGDLNASKDRVGVVSYDTEARYRLADGDDGYYISGDFDEVNTTVDDLDNTPNGGTRADRGMDKANSIIDLYSNETRDKVVILLTDGKNDGCKNDAVDDDPFDCYENRRALDFVNDSSTSGATVYTIGLGTDLDDTFLEAAAEFGGGSYHQVDNADELDEVFADIRSELANQKVIARTPMTSNMSSFSTGEVFRPQMAGDTDGVGNITVGGKTFLNINDPQAPTLFSHAFAVQDGEEIHMNVTEYECGTWVATGRTETHNGTSYEVTKCTNLTATNNSYRPRLDTDGDDTFDEDDGSDRADGLLLDGDNASALLEHTPGWWQQDINFSLSKFPDVSINKTKVPGPDGQWGKLSMNSNQALVVFDLPDGPESTNILVLLYQVGLSESQARGGVINVRISEVTVD